MPTARLMTAALALVVAACSTGGGATSTASPASTTPSPTPAASTAAAASPSTPPSPATPAAPGPSATSGGMTGGMDHGTATVEVAIRDFAFEPATITVAPGQTVRWTNEDGEPHTVRSEDGSISSPLLAKDPFRWTAPMTPGTIPYICSVHPKMKGTVEIEG